MATKTYAELTAAVDVEDGDLLATYRGSGPLKKLTAALLRSTYLDSHYLRLTGGTLTGPLVAAAGVVGAPGLSFASDTDCGFYRAGTNTVGVSINGVQVGRWETTGYIGNVTGNVTGDVVGNVTGDVVGNVTGDITGNNVPGATPTADNVGYLGMPVVAFSAGRSIAATDHGKALLLGGVSSFNLTVPLNATVALPVGFRTRFIVNNGSTAGVLAAGGVTLLWSAGTGNRTVTAVGFADLQKIATDTWLISGENVT